jgi:hypothetical protein
MPGLIFISAIHTVEEEGSRKWWRRLAPGRVAGWQPAKQPTDRRRYDSRHANTATDSLWRRLATGRIAD